MDVTYVSISIEKSIRLETSGYKGVKTSVENEMEGWVMTNSASLAEFLFW